MGEEDRTGKVRRTNPDIDIENDRRQRDEDGKPVEKRPPVKVNPGEHRKLNTILIIVMAVVLVVAFVMLFGANKSMDEYNKKLEQRIEMLEKRPVEVKKSVTIKKSVEVKKPAEAEEPADVKTP